LHTVEFGSLVAPQFLRILPHDNGKEDAMYKHILIPTDGSSLPEQAIRQGVALGWDKMPGQAKADYAVARACADGLELLFKK
jgi:hypothetical protein